MLHNIEDLMTAHQGTFHPDYANDSKYRYTVIPNDLLRDRTVSPACRWMIAYLSSNAPNWIIMVAQIVNHCKEFIGRDKVYALIDEAIEAGYMLREEKIVNGLKRVVYHISTDKKFKKSLPLPDSQDAERQDTEDQDAKEIPTTKNSNLKGKREREEAPPPPTPSPFVFTSKQSGKQRVKLTVDEHQGLLKALGEAKTLEMMERLDEYADLNPKRFKQYASHSTVIRKWAREDVSKASSSPKACNSAIAMEWFTKARALTQNNPLIEWGAEGVSFALGQSYTFIKYKDLGAKEQIIGRLRKMNYSVSELEKL